MHWLLLSSGMWRRVVCRPLPTVLRTLLPSSQEMEFAIYTALQGEQCVKLVSFAHTSVYRRASVLAAAGAAVIRPSNQKDQPGMQELSALSVLNFSLSQMIVISEIWRRKCVPRFGLGTFSGRLHSSVDPAWMNYFYTVESYMFRHTCKGATLF